MKVVRLIQVWIVFVVVVERASCDCVEGADCGQVKVIRVEDEHIDADLSVKA